MPVGYSIASILIAVVIIAACIALVLIAVQKMGIAIPQWIIQVFWILLVACVTIFAIRFLFSI